MKIDSVESDSELFGYRVGSCLVDDTTPFNYDEFVSLAARYELVYLFSDKKLSEYPDLPEVDIRVTLRQAAQRSSFPADVRSIQSAAVHDDPERNDSRTAFCECGPG